ncbi:bifunctional 23S rRNA (guanine(2069)-N(7))-methyltransferase RlmK/23S rRNA (guanine(2445)-N(2))-methyltransferase RlmL [Aliikangiella coralliicola]|uniref:Ribosomal RNA large subunit methyltransferase K/L n=1 Tax=Aliikangiella coralliicola TaxID=2592383 RepID=A0A545TWI6_9GAMM|nr:bifunctional 23S rRNA (guanine(2069)-N(7))-methyltransferase RlmK/23S rRNA (guanine(2445)-N(2))-methyltransferase RlmL [Aliikangiella coralliicola]TQV81574.1 bifunctional 23S rRNA (guanine(2069)-N(7))-methyltransferase RlmK/23S rRNA (guanine(2445)-N(2))-methyltransferase RlmL [Aliikangiella coralliicola]
MPQFIATCAKGLEYLLVDELVALGTNNVKEGLSQVSFECDWQGVYQVLMWSRLASRVFYPIASFDAEDDEVLYQQASIIDWSQHINPKKTFLVNSQSFRSRLSHTQFISQRVKDAIVDYFRDAEEQRPCVDFEEPDVVVHCRIRRDKVNLSIDLAGNGLHRRGYRAEGGGAPIKENLAAALLTRAGWPHASGVLFDPMCGSGTFLIEGAMMALDIAPGLYREYLGLFGWQQFNQKIWEQVKQEAEQRKQQGLQKGEIDIFGSDINPKSVRNAQTNAAIAGLDDFIKIRIAGIDQIAQFEYPDNGVLVVNPPYSERLGEYNQVKKLYHELGEVLKSHLKGWDASVLSPDKDFGHALGIRAKKIYKFNNGSIPCELLNFELTESNFIQRVSDDSVETDFKSKLSEQALQLCNRIEKKRDKLKRFLKKEGITCYRIYDADLPEYNAAIDVYEERLHIQEYRAPKSIDETIALRRLKEIERVAAGVFQIPRSQVFTKQRRRQKGDWQYTSQNEKPHSNADSDNFKQVNESGRKFWVNLSDYLDTGLFLDHRKTRQLVAQKSAGKTLLNLFCYTASVSVYAATAGAKSTVNVDMSRTYLDWAKRNFSLNKIKFDRHEFIRSNCMDWLKEAIEDGLKFDLIFLDPPTFSNSKKMSSHFDIQTDHCELIEQCGSLLSEGGELVFSNNFQKFEMEFEGNEQFSLTEITTKTHSQDFARNNLHRSWLIAKK